MISINYLMARGAAAGRVSKHAGRIGNQGLWYGLPGQTLDLHLLQKRNRRQPAAMNAGSATVSGRLFNSRFLENHVFARDRIVLAKLDLVGGDGDAATGMTVDAVDELIAETGRSASLAVAAPASSERAGSAPSEGTPLQFTHAGDRLRIVLPEPGRPNSGKQCRLLPLHPPVQLTILDGLG